jgi:dihydropteroate synthase
MTPPVPLRWSFRDKTLEFDRTRIMGVLNVTPDSFSDGGRYVDEQQAIERGLAMWAEGADIVDVGGESSRPGATPVPVEEEIRRVVPVIRALARQGGGLISVDTTKRRVAEEALGVGAHMINDISALGQDPGMARLAAAERAGLVLMHMQGTPADMQAAPRYAQVADEVIAYLRGRLEQAEAAGVDPASVCLDPGIGFGKTVAHNLELLAALPRLAALNRPVLVGLSRKSFLGVLTGRAVADRLAAGLGGLAYAILRGAHILRVHDVKESCDAARVVDILRSEEQPNVPARSHPNSAPQRGA